MCKHGTLEMVKLCKPRESGRLIVPVDACISEEIQNLNDAGVVTKGSCCGHSVSGQRKHALIDSESVEKAKGLGYHPTPYIYADGIFDGTYEMVLEGERE